jgi:hypothetical protein
MHVKGMGVGKLLLTRYGCDDRSLLGSFGSPYQREPPAAPIEKAGAVGRTAADPHADFSWRSWKGSTSALCQVAVRRSWWSAPHANKQNTWLQNLRNLLGLSGGESYSLRRLEQFRAIIE